MRERKRITVEELEKMTFSKKVATRNIEICDKLLGDEEKHIIMFDIFDGFAYCPNFKGHEYYLTYPKVSFFKESKVMTDKLKEFLGLDEDDEISVIDSLIGYRTLKCNI